jgi:catechol 2,3-dioxygenase-like lactoylglutathione lyase family enzyme
VLSDHETYATLPTSDLGRARAFYEETLGFRPDRQTPIGVHYRAAGGTLFSVTLSLGAPSGSHTQLGFAVRDIDQEVAELRQRGIVFEEYETPRTEAGIATTRAGRAAWFKDLDGNLIGLIELNGSDPSRDVR